MRDRSQLRALPSVDELLREIPELAAVGHAVARWIVRREIESARARMLAGGEAGDVAVAVRGAAAGLSARRLRPLINATGVVLHTNLGRAPLSAGAVAAAVDAAGSTALELDLDSGERGTRAPVAPTLAAALCDAEDALVVNNNAGALLLALSALARGREVIVSRGELIEIGGEFRLPDVMEASGAILREVGTTNRTRARDYRGAVGDRTALILTVHPSNFAIVGFTARPALTELVEIARAAAVPLLFDIGSGLLGPEDEPLAAEPDAQTALAAGADLVCFSGDKLLGGPQAGILAGRRELVERCRRSPIARAVRADKMTLAALEATLWAHAAGERSAIPTWVMLETPPEELGARARSVADAIGADVVPGRSVVGGGSLPGGTIPSVLVALRDPRPEAIARALRKGDPPVVARVERGSLLLDLRTVRPADDVALGEAVRAAVAGGSGR